jgi:glycosyltransferase involved in cell wall biosynthesis
LPTSSEITAVVCSWNAVKSIEACLKSLHENHVGEIIVVDANSTDGTREIANQLADVVLTDPGKGLGQARNIGVAVARFPYVLNVGVDNVMPAGSIDKMLCHLEQNGYTGVSAMTFMMDASKSYYSWAMNLYKRARYFPGERCVIGTPTLFKTETLTKYKFDDKMSWSDDGDLCSRLSNLGCRFAIAGVQVFELGSESFSSVLTRWKGYGKSDWETYSKYSTEWSFIRRLQSFIYPFKNELVLPFFRIQGINRFVVLPFLFLITIRRYGCWIAFALRAKYKK